MNRLLIAAALGGSLAWAAGSGTACAEPFFIEIETAPRYIERAPRSYYEGRPVYYYDGRWYYRHAGSWAYYREEPAPLMEFRMRPHHRHFHHHHHHHPGPPPGPRHHHHHHGD